MLTITLMGTAATMPLPDRALSAAFAACSGHGLLWDCGEGTQDVYKRQGVDSYNVSVAAGIILYEIQSQRAAQQA